MIKIFVSAVIEVTADEVWTVIRDFNNISNWHPLVERSTIEGGRPSDAVGCIRNYHLTDGVQVREQLLSLSDYNYSFSYAIIESGLDLDNFIAELKLTPVTLNNWTFCEWTAEFKTAPGKEQEKANFVSHEVFKVGFDGLKKHLEG
jgi:hypothetical protein